MAKFILDRGATELDHLGDHFAISKTTQDERET